MKGLLIAILFFPAICPAQLQLANIFSSDMVLQRDKPIKVWGKGNPGDKISIQIEQEFKTGTIKRDSTWMLTLSKRKGSSEPILMCVSSGSQTIELSNILIGDIWIASGQSNMEWPMGKEMHWKEEIKNAKQPLIRLNNPAPAGRFVYGVAYGDSLNRRLTKDSFYLWNGWKTSDSFSIREASAVAWYFARTIVEDTQIPIGIINLSIGGAPIETFIGREALRASQQFRLKVTGNWLENKYLPEWTRQRGKENVGENINGFRDDLGLNHAYKPGFAYESGIEPLLNLPVKGIIWYQGESNSLEKDRVAEYRELMKVLIHDYRSKWKQPLLPFYWVQLSSIDTTIYQSTFWPEFRDEQRKAMAEIKHGGMAVSSDIGLRTNVHPTNKKDVGNRLARWALKQDYQRIILPSGPLPKDAVYKNDTLAISFHWTNKLNTSNKGTVQGFSLDGNNAVQAVIKNNSVIILSATRPEYVYYGWKPYSDGNLVNEENLPASTFKIRVRE